MLEAWREEVVRAMLGRGLDHRRINELTGVHRTIIADIDHGRRKGKQVEPPVYGIARCPTCGGKVTMPCRACRMRAGKTSVQETA